MAGLASFVFSVFGFIETIQKYTISIIKKHDKNFNQQNKSVWLLLNNKKNTKPEVIIGANNSNSDTCKKIYCSMSGIL